MISAFIVTLFCAGAVYGGTWATVAAMPFGRSDHVAVTVGNRIIVMGGCVAAQVCGYSDNDCYCPTITASVISYDPQTDAWTPLASMPRQRTRGWAAAIGNMVYYLGGRDGSDTVIALTDVYDVTADTWSTPAALTLPVGVSDPFAFAINSTLYFGSGYYQDYSTVAAVWTYDTANTSARWRNDTAPAMSQGRGDTCSFVVNGLAYVLGGFFSDNFCRSLPNFEVYDPVARTWTQLADMDFGRGDPACAALHGQFHAFGGQNTTEVAGSCVNLAMTHVEAYTPAANEWVEEYPELPDPRFRFFAASLDGVDVAYIIGGQATETFSVNGSISYPVLAQTLRYSRLANPFPSATPSPAAAASTTPAPNVPLALGLGIGLGVGLPVVVAFIVLLWCCCRNTRPAAPVKAKAGEAGDLSRSSDDGASVPLTAGSTAATSTATSSQRTAGDDAGSSGDISSSSANTDSFTL